jgi:hypothetical protein
MKKLKLVVLLGAIFCSASVMRASTVYTYTGNQFTDADKSGLLSPFYKEITITLTFDRPFGSSEFFMLGTRYGPTLLDWQVSDGFFNFGPAYGGHLDLCVLSADASGKIDDWIVAAKNSGDDGWVAEDDSLPGYDQAAIMNVGALDSSAWISGLPGTWSGGGVAPEPGSFALVLGTLAAGIAYRRRKVSR